MVFSSAVENSNDAPATFQRLMQHCFRDEVFQILLVFLDDIIVFSRTVEEQIQRLEVVFQKLRQHGHTNDIKLHKRSEF